MGRVGAFLQVDRAGHGVRPAAETVRDWDEFAVPLALEAQREQASRCMNCGVAFCQAGVALGPAGVGMPGAGARSQGSGHAVGCPLHNLIPETNDLLYRGRFDDAVGRMALTNPFPEFTGRVCPAPCETACNLGLHKEAVTINDNERALSDYAWERGIDPLPVPAADAPVASVIGSGPAGLAVAWELARRAWRVRVFEKADRVGGLLMYGIPNMKLPKWVIDRRVDLMRESGIEFICGVDASEPAVADEIAVASDAVVIACGAGVARDVTLPGRELGGIHFALEYLGEVTSALLDERPAAIDAAGKDVVVIGGGDTGNDCVACALRQGAASVTQVIRAQRQPDTCDTQAVWPDERGVFAQGYGQREAAAVFGNDPRIFSMDTIAFSGEDGSDASSGPEDASAPNANATATATNAPNTVAAVHIQELSYEGGRHNVKGTEATIPAQLVLIAKGFTGADASVFEAFGVEAPGAPRMASSIASHGNDSSVTHCLRAADAQEGTPAIFVAGDAALGSTLVVNAIADGFDCAAEVAARN